MSDTPLILVVNDDGIESAGIIELAHQMRSLGEVLLVAPNTKHSGAGRGFPRGHNYQWSGVIEERTFELTDGEPLIGYAVDGTPAACVVHGIYEIASQDRPPDICVSGVNWGPNVGLGLYSSGTVGAAMEAANTGMPALAISQILPEDRPSTFDDKRAMMRTAAIKAVGIARAVLLERNDDSHLCLNINVPAGATEETEAVVSDLADTTGWRWNRIERTDFKKPHVLTFDVHPDLRPVEGTDMHEVFVNGRISVTPLTPKMQDPTASREGLQRILSM